MEYMVLTTVGLLDFWRVFLRLGYWRCHWLKRVGTAYFSLTPFLEIFYIGAKKVLVTQKGLVQGFLWWFVGFVWWGL